VSEALRTPFALVATDRSALRFFGTEAALGQEVMLANKGPFRVVAVVRAQPENAHLQFDLLVPFRLKIVAGRDFDKSYGVDHLESFIVNEQAVKALGWGSPEAAIGQTVQCAGKNARVVGVVNDFNVESLRVGMQPLLLEVSPGRFTRFAIKIAPSDVDNTLSFIEKKWREHFPEKVFESSFLDQALADSYSEETRFGKLIGLFAGIAISLSCFGLFGMIVFVVQRRTKEIGIRKVLGASAAGITGLLAKDFLKLVLIAILVARPVSYYFMDKWLADFAYRIDLDWWLFAGAGLLAVAVAFLGGFPEHESCAGKPGEVVAERVTAMAVRNLGKCYSAKN
jgi:putative ABC transport system permease protein